MAFSLRKMLSNITYFSKPGEEENPEICNDLIGANRHLDHFSLFPTSENIKFDNVEADCTSICATSLKLPESVKSYAAKKGSLSDTDILSMNIDGTAKQDRKKCRKLKVDIETASWSMNNSVNQSEDSSVNVENTPKHKHLDCKCAELFKGFNFNQSFDISDAISVASSCDEEMDIQSLSDHSDTDISGENVDKVDIKMCRKVDHLSQTELVPSATPESFADIEVCANEGERIEQLFHIHSELERVNLWVIKLLKQCQYHIDVSKVLNCRSIVNALPGSNIANNQNTLGGFMYNDNIECGVSPSGWNVIMEKEDTETKKKLKDQLLEIRHTIEEFVNTYLEDSKPKLTHQDLTCTTFDLHKGSRQYKTNHISYKKKMKHFDFPDLRDALINLFSAEDYDICDTDVNDTVCSKCSCQCHLPTDSGLITKPDKDTSIQSITSSIGNFTLDSTTLSAYSESLDQIVSYNSFNDTNNNSLYNMLLQKPAIERITFYIQVHSIQLKCEPKEMDFESKNAITFYCPTCKTTENEENSLLRHILSPSHCEKIHFVYKTAYVKKCISSGKEIQPSTVLNPMTIYRDDNKIVCFGEALYACSLCFENLIIGESILMSHCSDEEHVNRRIMLAEIFE